MGSTIQYMGLRGYLPGWTADLDKQIDIETAKSWSKLSETEIVPEGKTRRQVLQEIYNGEKLE